MEWKKPQQELPEEGQTVLVAYVIDNYPFAQTLDVHLGGWAGYRESGRDWWFVSHERQGGGAKEPDYWLAIPPIPLSEIPFLADESTLNKTPTK